MSLSNNWICSRQMLLDSLGRPRERPLGHLCDALGMRVSVASGGNQDQGGGGVELRFREPGRDLFGHRTVAAPGAAIIVAADD